MQLLPRALETLMRNVLSASPVVVVEGARRVGKSTLVGMVGDASTTDTTMGDAALNIREHFKTGNCGPVWRRMDDDLGAA
jgi:predicted ATPase